MVVDPKGVVVEIDSLVEGLIGSWDNKAAKGRVFFVSPFGWVAFWEAERGKQHISPAGKFLVRDGPRPIAKRTDIPERLKR